MCVVLTIAAFFFSKDANELALGPIERMITKVLKNRKFAKKERGKEGMGLLEAEGEK